mgnify:CR=1 FL=1
MKQKATLKLKNGKEIDVKIDKKKRCIEIAEEDLKKLIKKPFPQHVETTADDDWYE